MNEKPVILAVDDEEHILELISYNLEVNGFTPLTAESGEEALEVLKEEDVDLVLLDLMMDGIDGLEVLRRIRQNPFTKDMAVIILTAKGEEINKVLGLELGADDYISKPFGVHELIARIKAVLRRSTRTKKKSLEEEKQQEIRVGDMTIDYRSRDVRIGDEVIHLPLKEFELLYFLAINRGEVFSRDQLLDQIWGYDYYGETRTVDVHIRNLRKKIEKDDTNPKYIKTVRGVGYKLL
jgi:two-component system alkaline phosphatase synthesis response regulator PhoP